MGVDRIGIPKKEDFVNASMRSMGANRFSVITFSKQNDEENYWDESKDGESDLSDKLKSGIGALGGMIMKAAKDKMDSTKEADLGKNEKLSQEEKCMDDADACELDDEPVVAKVKEANLGKANNPMELDEKCFDDADACELEEEAQVAKEAKLGKADKMTEEEKCMDDADACETEEPIEKKIMRQKEAKLGESDVKADPRDQCFDDGINCDVSWDNSEPSMNVRKNVNPEVLKESNAGKASNP